MPENSVQNNADNACTGSASNAIHGHINDFLVCTGLVVGIGERELLCLATQLAEIALMTGRTFYQSLSMFEVNPRSDLVYAMRLSSRSLQYH